MDISREYLAGLFTREEGMRGVFRVILERASQRAREHWVVGQAIWVRRVVVLTSVKALIWPFAISTLEPKQSDKVVGLGSLF